MTTGSVSALPHQEDQDLIDRIIGDHAGRPGALLGILEKLQDRNRDKYLPMETLEYVAARTGVPQSQVYGVATFYALFNLDPQGAHTIAICRGTACHTRGSRALLERVKLQLGLQQRQPVGEPMRRVRPHEPVGLPGRVCRSGQPERLGGPVSCGCSVLHHQGQLGPEHQPLQLVTGG